MPDLTIVSMQMCSQLNQATSYVGGYEQNFGQFEPTCTCQAYKFSKRGNKGCKHIRQAEVERCDWHEQYSTPQTPEQRKAMACPQCGGPTIWVQVGV